MLEKIFGLYSRMRKSSACNIIRNKLIDIEYKIKSETDPDMLEVFKLARNVIKSELDKYELELTHSKLKRSNFKIYKFYSDIDHIVIWKNVNRFNINNMLNIPKSKKFTFTVGLRINKNSIKDNSKRFNAIFNKDVPNTYFSFDYNKLHKIILNTFEKYIDTNITVDEFYNKLTSNSELKRTSTHINIFKYDSINIDSASIVRDTDLYKNIIIYRDNIDRLDNSDSIKRFIINDINLDITHVTDMFIYDGEILYHISNIITYRCFLISLLQYFKNKLYKDVDHTYTLDNMDFEVGGKRTDLCPIIDVNLDKIVSTYKSSYEYMESKFPNYLPSKDYIPTNDDIFNHVITVLGSINHTLTTLGSVKYDRDVN